jgi:hypothetical protein
MPYYCIHIADGTLDAEAGTAGFGPALKRLGRTVPARCHGGCKHSLLLKKHEARQPPRHYAKHEGPWPCSLAPEPLGGRPLWNESERAAGSTPVAPTRDSEAAAAAR